MSAASEFSRPVRLDTIGGDPRDLSLAANADERAALAARFALPAIDLLEADATIRREGERVWAEGRIRARATQSCVATGDPVPAVVNEAFALRFDPAEAIAGLEELELDAGDLDVIEYRGGAIDLGEAVAQGFALALDPFPRSAGAAEALRAAGVLAEEEAEAARVAATNPFAALKGLKRN